jgi:hypothetical protein
MGAKGDVWEGYGLTFWISLLDIFRLRFLHSAVIIHKCKCIFVFGIHIALCALVSRTEVALILVRNRVLKRNSGEILRGRTLEA